MTVPVMDLLRESTAEMHTSAEGNQFQHQLGSGKVAPEHYGQYLEQLYLMHKKLADLLDGSKPANGALQKVVNDYHLDLTCVKNDLAHFGRKPESATALNATEQLMTSMQNSANSDSSELLGFLYVLEGSTNGAKFMAKSLRAGLGLPEEAGASYFDRYGEKQRERWMAFKSAMNEIEFSEQQRGALVDKAKETFRSFGRIGDEIMQ